MTRRSPFAKPSRLYSRRVFALGPQASWSNVELREGLLAYFPYDSDAVDTVGGVHSPADLSSPTFTTGFRGNALNSSGSAVAWVKAFAGVGVSFWVKTTGSSSSSSITVAVNYSGGYALRFTVQRSTRKVQVGAVATLSVYDSGSGFLTADTWQHLAATHDGEVLRVYVDGTVMFATANALDPHFTSTTIQTSAVTNQVLIDDLCVYGRPLTPAEVVALYNGGNGLTPTSA